MIMKIVLKIQKRTVNNGSYNGKWCLKFDFYFLDITLDWSLAAAPLLGDDISGFLKHRRSESEAVAYLSRTF